MGESAAKFRPEIDLDEFERRLRAGAPAPRPSQAENADPLAELARLLGSDSVAKKEDPFEALFRAQAAIADIRNAPAPLQAPHEPYFAESPDFRRQERQADAGGRELADHQEASPYAAEPLPYQEAEPNWEPEAAQEDATGWDPNYDEAGAQMAPAPARRRKVAFAMAGVLLLGVAAIGGTLAMRAKSGGQEVVTIQADADPARVKPDQADNSTTSNSQTLFDRKDNNVAKVVANQEQPADLGATVKSARVVGPASGVPTPPAPVAAAPAPQGDAPFPQP